MIVTSVRDNLHRGLAIANRAFQSRTTLPITQNVLIKTNPQGLSLTITNLQLTITTHIQAIVDREGAITIPARMFTEFINTLPNEPVKLTVPPGSMVANIACASAHANFNGASPNEFPPIPQVTEGLSASIDPKEFIKAIARTSFAAASEESRPVLTGVSLAIDNDTLTMAAADGFRLAINKTILPDPTPTPISAIIPASTLSQLNRILPDEENPVNILFDNDSALVTFNLSNTQIVSQLLKGEYPDYETLVPANTSTNCLINTKNLLQATKTASIFAKESSNIVRMEFQKNPTESEQPVVLISAEAEEIGSNQGQVDIDSMEGEDTKIAFNSRYLTELLTILEPEQVTLSTTVPTAPGVFSTGDLDGYRHIIMPMFVQW